MSTNKKSKQQLDHKVAIHESGHAVVGYVLGLHCARIALVTEDDDESDCYGFVSVPSAAYGYVHTSKRDRQVVMMDQCVAACAGLASEHVFFGTPLDIENENAQVDFINILRMEHDDDLRIGRKLDGPVGDEQSWNFIKRQLVKARRIVKRHRDAIERLAAILVEKRTIDGQDLEQLLGELIPQ